MNSNIAIIVRESSMTETGSFKVYLYENAKEIVMTIDNISVPEIAYIRFTLDNERYFIEKILTEEIVWNTLCKLGGLKDE